MGICHREEVENSRVGSTLLLLIPGADQIKQMSGDFSLLNTVEGYRAQAQQGLSSFLTQHIIYLTT